MARSTPIRKATAALALCALLIASAAASAEEANGSEAAGLEAGVGQDGAPLSKESYEAETQRLQSMLNWAIMNSDPEVLSKAAASGESGTSEGRKADFDRIREEMREVIDSQISETDVMKESIDVLRRSRDGSVSLERQLVELDELDNLVSHIDNANDFVKLGGLGVLLTLCSGDDEGSDRRTTCPLALQVLGVASSKNDFFIAKACEENPAMVADLTAWLEDASAEPAIATKASFALSSMANADAVRRRFDALGGPATLVGILASDAEALAKLRKKVLALVHDFIVQDGPPAAELYLSQGPNPAVFTRFLAHEDLDVNEKCLLLLTEFAEHLPIARARLLWDEATVRAFEAKVAGMMAEREGEGVGYLRALTSMAADLEARIGGGANEPKGEL